MKVLVTGAAGQLGSALLRSAPGEVEVIGCTRADLDIRDAAAVRARMASERPDVVINAAACTAVDAAESQPELAEAVNGAGPGHLAAAVRACRGCRLIHLSTDYVFDGRASRPYRPDDATQPLNVYGRSKLAGEQAVAVVLEGAGITLRTAWVYAASGRNFLTTMLQRMVAHGAVRVVADQIGTPTSVDSLCTLLWRCTQQRWAGGVYHWTDAGAASWYDFAVAIAEEAGAAGLLPRGVEVTPIATEEYLTTAARPAFSLLDCRATWAAAGLRPGHWRAALRATLAGLCRPARTP